MNTTLNNTAVSKDVNSTTNGTKISNMTRIGLVIQAVLLNLSLHHAEGDVIAGSLFGPKFWDGVAFPKKQYFVPLIREDHDDRYRPRDIYYDSDYDYGTGYGGSYGQDDGGERGWSQGSQDSRRQGQISAGFSNSYSKNERGDASVYYNDGLARSANHDYTGLGSSYRGGDNGYQHGSHSDRGRDTRGYPGRDKSYLNPFPYVDRSSYWKFPFPAFSRASRVHVPRKKTGFYVVPTPKVYYVDKPPKDD